MKLALRPVVKDSTEWNHTNAIVNARQPERNAERNEKRLAAICAYLVESGMDRKLAAKMHIFVSEYGMDAFTLMFESFLENFGERWLAANCAPF